MMNTPRILVCTVDAWSEKVGSNTMSALLEGYDKDKIACLNIRAELSDSPVCNRYFHIIEGRIIKSIFNRSVLTGEEHQVHNLRLKYSTTEPLSL